MNNADNTKPVRRTLYLPGDVAAWLEGAAAEHDCSMSRVVARLLKVQMAAESKPVKPR